MSQHDYNIANGGGAAVRSDINSALGAIQSLNSGTTAPTTTVAGMLWYDTLTGSLKQRNAGNTAWVSAAELIAGGQLAGLRNRIINGNMNISQRGTSFASAGGYTLDRWVYGNTSSGVVTAAQITNDYPAISGLQASLSLAVTTADTSITAGDNSVLQQVIEGYNVRDLVGNTFTLSFWVRSAKIGTHCVAFCNSTPDRSYVAEYTISAANTWEKKTITVTGGLILTGTWDWLNGAGLRVYFTLAAGTTFQTTAGAWQTGNFRSTSNQVNCLDTIGNTFAITGVQLEPGGVATPFEQRPYGMELALCQRYFLAATFYVPAGPASIGYVTYPVTMRATPTVVGGGVGYAQLTPTAAATAHYQTAAAGQALSFSIEL